MADPTGVSSSGHAVAGCFLHRQRSTASDSEGNSSR